MIHNTFKGNGQNFVVYFRFLKELDSILVFFLLPARTCQYIPSTPLPFQYSLTIRLRPAKRRYWQRR